MCLAIFLTVTRRGFDYCSSFNFVDCVNVVALINAALTVPILPEYAGQTWQKRISGTINACVCCKACDILPEVCKLVTLKAARLRLYF